MKFSIPKEAMTGEGKALFSFLVSCIAKFLKKNGIDTDRHFELGFTFSFPVKQRSVASGKLVVWTKGFDARGVVGKDVVVLLREALKRERLAGIRVAALANDTVGTLMARAYSDKYCDMGVIIGTGTNACYTERISRITKLRGFTVGGESRMIVNIEWGNFDKLKKTVYDIRLDRATDNPGRQILEKMVSGMYLGELVRLALVRLSEKGLFFCGTAFLDITKPISLKSEHVSLIESDRSPGLSKTGLLLKKLGVTGSSRNDRCIIKDVCGAVSDRAARISAAAMAAVITRMDPAVSDKHSIAIDGSVYGKHPNFSRNIGRALKEIFGHKASRINLVLSKDGSGKGSAIIAAVAASKYGSRI
jgi:hexokinase